MEPETQVSEVGQGAESPQGGPGGVVEAQLAGLRAELETSRAELETSRATVAAATEQIAQAQAEAQARALELETRSAELQGVALAAHRRALLAENAGQVIAELVQGDSVEALEASVASAKEAYARVVEAVKAQAATMVPAGASPRSEPQLEELSPIQKITQALTGNSRR